jgi:hypothetical protein
LAFREKIDRRENAMLDVLTKRPRSLEDLVAHRFLYSPGHHDIYIEEAERHTLVHHLDELIAAGRVALDGGIYSRVQGGR